MTERERLYELIVDAENKFYSETPCGTDTARIEKVVDHLLENGVILPPVKVGDTMWFITGIHNWIAKSAKIVEIVVGKANVTDLTVETDNGIYLADTISDFFSPAKKQKKQFDTAKGKTHDPETLCQIVYVRRILPQHCASGGSVDENRCQTCGKRAGRYLPTTDAIVDLRKEVNTG